jgi:hypothetical protein
MPEHASGDHGQAERKPRKRQKPSLVKLLRESTIARDPPSGLKTRRSASQNVPEVSFSSGPVLG